MDLMTRAHHLPCAGETLAGESFSTFLGGKGANQAVAAARLGASVSMVGCVGADGYGEQLLNALMADGIDCQAVTSVVGVSSGVALIVVDAQGQNTIVIVAGSNDHLSVELLQTFDEVIQAGDIVVCQLEVPMRTVAFALERGRELEKTVILNPAPVKGPLPQSWYGLIDYLIPNESEASALSGVLVDSLGSAEQAAAVLMGLGVEKVIITLGAQGALFASGDGCVHFPAQQVNALDTTAAGDTFVGGFAAALAAGKSEHEAIRFGQRAAAVSVTRQGAQCSIPLLSEL